jgi:hypothetical protein
MKELRDIFRSDHYKNGKLLLLYYIKINLLSPPEKKVL